MQVVAVKHIDVGTFTIADQDDMAIGRCFAAQAFNGMAQRGAEAGGMTGAQRGQSQRQRGRVGVIEIVHPQIVDLMPGVGAEAMHCDPVTIASAIFHQGACRLATQFEHTVGSVTDPVVA